VADRELARRTVKTGLIGGVTVVYLAAVGMIGDFNARNLIGDQVTLGRTLLALPAFLAGFLVSRPRVRGGQIEVMAPRRAILAGIGCGALIGGITIAAVALVKVFSPNTVHDMWIAVTPALLGIITLVTAFRSQR
jgi:hypothetical protein